MLSSIKLYCSALVGTISKEDYLSRRFNSALNLNTSSIAFTKHGIDSEKCRTPARGSGCPYFPSVLLFEAQKF